MFLDPVVVGRLLHHCRLSGDWPDLRKTRAACLASQSSSVSTGARHARNLGWLDWLAGWLAKAPPRRFFRPRPATRHIINVRVLLRVGHAVAALPWHTHHFDLDLDMMDVVESPSNCPAEMHHVPRPAVIRLYLVSDLKFHRQVHVH